MSYDLVIFPYSNKILALIKTEGDVKLNQNMLVSR